MASVVWSEQATGNLFRIAAYLARYDADAASRIGRALLAAGESLRDFPRRGRPSGGATRELVTVPPYVVRYEVIGDVVLILSVRHGRRQPSA